MKCKSTFRPIVKAGCHYKVELHASLNSGHPPSLPAPPILPDLLADQAIDPRLPALRCCRHHPALRLQAGDFEQQFCADRFLELVAVLDRDDEGAGTADHAVLVIV